MRPKKLPAGTTQRLALAAFCAALTSAAFAQRAATTVVRTATRPAIHTATARPAPGHAASQPAPTVLVKTNPLLPAPIPLESFFYDLTLLPKTAPNFTKTPGFAPLFTPDDWQTFRATYGAELDGINRLKSSAQLALAQKLIEAAVGDNHSPTPGLQRLLLLRAAAIAYRSKEGYPVADSAVTAYLTRMDKSAATQMGALWTISNTISRMAVTPKPERIRYDAIAAKANMQLCLLLLEADQVTAAQSLIKQIAYHEGWLKSDPATRALISQVRNRVTSTAKMTDFLATQYDPAIHNDPAALMVVYLYGRYVKNNPGIVADLPARIPNSALAQLAASLEAAAHDATAAFTAAENLRTVAVTLPDGAGPLIKQRTLYASLENYRNFLAAPETERDRVHRTLARMAVEGVISDGARRATAIDPFAPPPAPVPAPGAPQGAHPEPTAVGAADFRRIPSA